LLSKAFHNWVANVSWMTKKLKRRCGIDWDNSQKTSMLRVTDKAMGKAYQYWRKICEEICFFPPSFEYHIFYVSYPFVTYLLTLLLNFLYIWKWERLQIHSGI
jgi:hypothetical protein